ncbi:MAG TPA: nicotinate-nucleotide adenylyltransferase [Solirubrobacteraceae bacterium]|nr:nicotinate-nucleotide adenylyltransferase [Solirubrobacteraceae bacterium]
MIGPARPAVGILGGTFNPPHLGHLVMAQEARDQLGLERVVLMPAGVPPHKEVLGADPGPAARLELCRLAAADDDGLAVWDLEMRRAGPSFTVDTLRVLHERDPELDLTFIVGGDMAETLPSWREPEAVLGLARLAVAERSGVRREALMERLAPLRGSERVAFFDMPRLDISSSDIRERVAGGRPIRHLVPDAVAAEIAARRYYRPRAGSPVA